MRDMKHFTSATPGGKPHRTFPGVALQRAGGGRPLLKSGGAQVAGCRLAGAAVGQNFEIDFLAFIER
jgi:hypothetical protein